MEKIIIIKYGELTTKKDNINFFLKILKSNIDKSLLGMEVNIKYDRGRMYIFPLKDNYDEIINKLKNVFGIHEIVTGYKLDTVSFEDIGIKTIELLKEKEFSTFKVVTKRSDKSYPLTSMEINKELGALILKKKKGISVDVNTPELIVNVEIRQDNTYVYFDGIAGFGGFPVGSLGKGLLMLSGGIDSPVAGFLSMKRGVKLECIYFDAPPHTTPEAKNKVISLAKKLAIYNREIKLHVINFTEIQEAIYKNIPHDYLITIMRRMMYRISSLVAKNNRCHIIVNGESIGQVASQTLTSMSVINECIKIPVIRPIACFNKNEIIEIAKEIGTYETSILPFEDCCTIFVPLHPVINPTLAKVLEYEKLIDVDDLIHRAYKEHELIKSTDKDIKEYEDIL